MTLRALAPAKINLHLRVFPVGEEGFHPLRSWFRTVDLQDELIIQTFPKRWAGGGPIPFKVIASCLPSGTDNIVDGVGRALRRALGVHEDPSIPATRVFLSKNIPIGGGLGGGSSDAAAALVGLREAWQLNLGNEVFTSAAQTLGSDVPFFLHHQLEGITDATCTGRGEIVQPFTPGQRHAVLLMLPGLHISTPAVYGKFDALPAPPDDGDPDFHAWSHLSAPELLPLLRNDLEPAAFALHPELGRLRGDLEQHLGRIIRMTGSGSTLFTLFDDRAGAEVAASGLRDFPVRPLIA